MQIEYICFTTNNGYSVAARNNILALKDDYDIRIAPLDFRNSKKYAGPDLKIFRKMEKKYPDPKRIQIFHCIPPMQRRHKARNSITLGVATFETFDPPDHWIKVLDKNTATLAPSLFNVEIFKSDNRKVYYYPHCISMTRYNPEVTARTTYPEFVYMFIGSWKHRKGACDLIQAWCEEFYKRDNVLLLILTDKPVQAEQTVRSMRKIYRGDASIVVHPGFVLEEDMPGFIRSADCLISPTRGEGFGLPGLQAMACGVPVVITDTSGCKDYAHEDTCTLMQPDGIVSCRSMDNIPQFTNKRWTQVSVTKIKKTMRHVLNSQKEITLKAINARNYVEKHFSFPAFTKNFSEILEDLL